MADLGSIYIFVTIFCSCVFVMVNCGGCPHHANDPNNVNDRIDMLKDQRQYSCVDDSNKYSYSILICQTGKDPTAVKQAKKGSKRIYNAGTYESATIRGGTDWLMVSYGGGEKYQSHCQKAPRKSDLLIICDPNESRGTLKVIEEHRTNDTHTTDPCYYLFELNHKAACTVGPPKTISPGSILLIIFLIVVSVYLVLGFLYQRFVAGAKGFEQIPNFNMWRAFGNLQADGCNFICRCAEVRRSPRYKPVEDALSDDTAPPDDDSLLPM
ncbi:cation-dependent mannose-6-phosphate receptor-like [Actinia tenebrosa]|uniref:Cation-dependent mannose-6-phosphate receptor-like n=1 Tax=Actinia tenebrosa TaxID=6105 RepID=A0A6P8H0S4_ACTTE|nr:cation-dependent mannose-6-phosphate receptor-like [Actinia tenebrosa]